MLMGIHRGSARMHKTSSSNRTKWAQHPTPRKTIFATDSYWGKGEKNHFFSMNGIHWACQPHSRAGPMLRESWTTQNGLCFYKAREGNWSRLVRKEGYWEELGKGEIWQNTLSKFIFKIQPFRKQWNLSLPPEYKVLKTSLVTILGVWHKAQWVESVILLVSLLSLTWSPMFNLLFST